MQRTAPVPSRQAFTLVELLVVIAIIVILMSLLLTAIPAVKEAARKTEARNSANQIVVALNSYYTEYAKFPPLDSGDTPPPTGGAAQGDSVVGDPAMGAVKGPNNTVFYTLRSIPQGLNMDYAMNPRKVVFFEGKAASVNAANKARGGFFDRTSGGGTPSSTEASCLYDPWGCQYGIIMDTDGDDRIDLVNFYSDFSGVDPTTGRAPRRKVGAFSMGKDNKLGNNGSGAYSNGTEKSDDVVTWE